MNVLLLALQASLCFLAQAGLMTPNLNVPVHNKPVPIDILNQLPKIVGGVNANKNEFPFMVHMLVKWGPGKYSACGASIINQDFVLTAGHCVYNADYGWAQPQNVNMYVGKYENSFNSEYAQVVQGSEISHLGYDTSNNHQNDIAIIRVAEKIQIITGTVQPICLASGTSTYADRYGTVIGWGVNAYGYYPGRDDVAPTDPQYQQKAQMYILPSSKCAQLIGSGHATPGKICIYDDKNAKKGVCSGDSGGPLVVVENGFYVQVGIASYIVPPCGAQNPSVYTRVTNYKNFIEQVVGAGNYLDC